MECSLRRTDIEVCLARCVLLSFFVDAKIMLVAEVSFLILRYVFAVIEISSCIATWIDLV